LARARQFYEGKLGFKPKQEINGGVAYEFGGGTACFLYPTPNAGTSKASQAFWSVADVDREIQALKARGGPSRITTCRARRAPPGPLRQARQGRVVQGQ